MNERAALVERAVRIEDEIARRGIRLRGGIDRCGPCPRCGGTDGFSINLKKQVFNCRRGSTGGDVIALVRHLDGVGYLDAIALLAGPAPQRTVCSIPKQRYQAVKNNEEKDNASKAAWLWNNRRPIAEDCPAGLYLRKTRGYGGPIPSTIGYLPANGKHPPAMIAAFGFCEEPEPPGVIDPPAEVTGVHITRLAQDGGKAPIDPVKIMLGPSAGLPIVLAPANDLLAIDIAEGIEKGLLIQADTGAGMWAAGSAGNMPKIAAALPHYAECVTIWADRDETGLRLAREAARIIQARKIEARIKGIPDE
jgi:hypothetical protein